MQAGMPCMLNPNPACPVCGQVVEVKERDVRISVLELSREAGSRDVAFRVACSKGTYIRSLVNDMVSRNCITSLVHESQQCHDTWPMVPSILIPERRAPGQLL